jgi:hypothetical protein
VGVRVEVRVGVRYSRRGWIGWTRTWGPGKGWTRMMDKDDGQAGKDARMQGCGRHRNFPYTLMDSKALRGQVRQSASSCPGRPPMKARRPLPPLPPRESRESESLESPFKSLVSFIVQSPMRFFPPLGLRPVVPNLSTGKVFLFLVLPTPYSLPYLLPTPYLSLPLNNHAAIPLASSSQR